MPDRLSNSDHLEQELNELQAGIQRSVEVLKELEGVQEHFSTLASTYNELTVLLDDAKVTFEKRRGAADSLLRDIESNGYALLERLSKHMEEQGKLFRSLEERNQAEWQEFRQTLLKTQEDLKAANKNLRTEVGLQINDLQGEVESRLTQFHARLEERSEQLNERFAEAESRAEAYYEATHREQKTLKESLRAVRAKARTSSFLGGAGILIGAVAVALHFYL